MGIILLGEWRKSLPKAEGVGSEQARAMVSSHPFLKLAGAAFWASAVRDRKPIGFDVCGP